MLHSATFEASVGFPMEGKQVDLALKGAASKEGATFSMRATGIPEAAGKDFQMVVRGNRAWVSTTNGKWAAMPVPKEMNGMSGSMGADAFQELARYVRDVRVAEHQQIGGKPVTTIAGEIDTAGMIKAVAKLGSLSGPGGEKPAFSFDLDDLGVKFDDIKAVLSIDESTHLLSTALVTLGMEAQGKKLEASSSATGSPARTSRSSSRPSPASHSTRFGAWTPTVSGGCECRPSSSPRRRCSSRCGTSRARTSTPARSRCSRSRRSPGSRPPSASSTARTLYDDPEYDALLVAVWAVIAGGVIAFAGYFIVGGALYLGTRGLGSVGTFRRARHILGFAVAPIALSLVLVWPLQLAVYGGDVFRRGGSDDGAGARFFDLLELGFAAWAAVLLLVGVRAVHGWTWWRSLGALGLVALFLAAFASLRSVF